MVKLGCSKHFTAAMGTYLSAAKLYLKRRIIHEKKIDFSSYGGGNGSWPERTCNGRGSAVYGRQACSHSHKRHARIL